MVNQLLLMYPDNDPVLDRPDLLPGSVLFFGSVRESVKSLVGQGVAVLVTPPLSSTGGTPWDESGC
jgi:hypothetical protein